MTIYDRLEAIASDKAADGYLRAYRADLTKYDRLELEESKAGQRFLWILRECGTELFAAVWATCWLGKGNSTTPSLPYLVTMTADGGASGSVVPTDYESAIELAHIPHPDGKKIRISLSG